jgi:hypothetical protein
MKWGDWLAAIATLILASFGVALRLIYSDAKTAVEAGKAQRRSKQDAVGHNLSRLDLRVHSLETVSTGGKPSALAFAKLGCDASSALDKGGKVAYCAQGSPPLLFQMTPGGDQRPVSGLSPIGFAQPCRPGVGRRRSR